MIWEKKTFKMHKIVNKLEMLDQINFSLINRFDIKIKFTEIKLKTI